MFSNKVFTALVLLILVVTFFVIPSQGFAQFGFQQKQISEAQWSRGFHGFNMIADGNDLKPVDYQTFSASNSKDVLLIAMGSLGGFKKAVTDHVANGGSALLANDSSGGAAGFHFNRLVEYPTEDADSFGGMPDCPMVSDFRDHPIVSGVDRIATNRPGYVWADEQTAVGWLPSVFQKNIAGYFIAASENRKGGRVVAVADQSIFTNQMILFEGNARFADQSLKWLKNGRLQKMLILVNGRAYSTLSPTDVTVDLPAPTREEVFDALESLPPSAMLDFVNSVATVVEDENMVNDLIHDSMEKIPERAFNRFYIFFMFGVACLSFVTAFLFQRKLQSRTASHIAHKQSQSEQADLKVIQSRERQQAAHMLLDRFCMDLANMRFNDWPSFPTGLNVDEDRQSEKLFTSMTHMSVSYKSQPASFWTRKKLALLEQSVNDWRTYFKNRPALADSELIQNQSGWSNQTLDGE